MHIHSVAASVAILSCTSCSWSYLVYASAVPFGPPPSPPPHVYGPAEWHDSAHVSSRYDASSYQQGYDTAWLKKYNLRPPRPFPFPVEAEVTGPGYVQMPLRSARSTSATDGGNGATRRSRPRSEWPPRPEHLGANYYTPVRPDTTFEAVNSTGTATVPPRLWAYQSLTEFGAGVGFMTELDIGTPPQITQLQVDTGSVSTWVNPTCADRYQGNNDFCNSNGHYDPALSKTSRRLSESFYFTYGSPGSGAEGQMYEDTVSIDGNYSLLNFPIAVANYTQTLLVGLLGLAYSERVKTVVTSLVSQGYIRMPVFGLALGHYEKGEGQIVFGGVNRHKYSGQLTPVPIWPSFAQQAKAPDSESQGFYKWSMNLTGVGIQVEDQPPQIIYEGHDEFIIDTGSTISYAPDTIIGNLGYALWAVKTEQNEILVNCDIRNMRGAVRFYFNGFKLRIDVNFKDFILNYNSTNCALGVQPASVYNSSNILGTTFLRGAYMVFDPTVECIWMATYTNCGEGVIAVGSQPGDTQQVTGLCPAPSTLSTPAAP